MGVSDSLLLLLAEHGLALLFGNVLLEQAGLPIPAYPSLVVAGTLAQHGSQPSIAAVFGVAVLACLIADTAWFWLGRKRGAWLMRGICKVSLSPDSCIRKSSHLYRQLGPRLLLVAKFLPGAGALTTLMAGTSGTSLTAFLLYDIAGSAIWVASALMMGIVFENAVWVLLGLLTTYVLPGVLAVLAAFAAFLTWKWLGRARLIRRSRKVPRLGVMELMAMQTSGQPHIVVDVRQDTGENDARIPGAIQMAIDAKPAELNALPANVSVVVYCDCPSEISAAYLAERIRAIGRPDVFALEGGIRAWSEVAGAGAPHSTD
ncbi:MAG: VTT domain-containing protein [Burkholderiaceae bacterium]